MKRLAAIFVVAVLTPGILLAWLAGRSLRGQREILERQEQLACDALAEGIARDIRDALDALHGEFTEHVTDLLRTGPAHELAQTFHERLPEVWPTARLGFAVDPSGDIASPPVWAGQEAAKFRFENDRFLASHEALEMVWNGPKGKVPISKLNALAPPARLSSTNCVFVTCNGVPATPSQDPANPAPFRNIIEGSTRGTLARFLQDELVLLFWIRPENAGDYVFGAKIDLPRVAEMVAPVLRIDPALAKLYSVTLRDIYNHRIAGTPAAIPLPPPGSADAGTGDRPFAVAEIGEMLPHYDVAIHRLDPARASRFAAAQRWYLGLLIGVLVIAMAAGTGLVATDIRRQLVAARQKSDFVSCVSHELKTPLTSIRMFSEMLSENRITDPEKRAQCLAIIASEAGRLTQLIEGVLSFARLDHGLEPPALARVSLRCIIQKAVEACRVQIEDAGIVIHVKLPASDVLIQGDPGALQHALMNLLSNVEKYAASGGVLEIDLAAPARDNPRAQIVVADRGPGIHRRSEERIFEQFYRAPDSLASGIPGSGLGLTIARRIARAHGGELTARRREGGGLELLLDLPA